MEHMNKLFKEHTDFINKLNKTHKNNPAYKKCDEFCKNDYIDKYNTKNKNNAKKFKYKYKPLTKKQLKFANGMCKKTFCNPTCDGFKDTIPLQLHTTFKKQIKNGFHKKYSIKQLKERGTMSGCTFLPFII